MIQSRIIITLVFPFRSLRIVVYLTLAVIRRLPSHIIDYIIAPLQTLLYLLREIESTQWALSLDLEPLQATLCVEVVLGIAREDYDILIRGKGYQTNGAVWHLTVFLLVLGVGHVLQTGHVPL